MASKVLKSFLIGIGYDTKALEAGDKKIGASLNGIKSNALGISAALVGAFGAGASAIVGVANRVDKLAMSTQNLRTSQAAVYSYGNALKLMGGDAADAVETLAHFEEIQNNLRLKGDAGPINDLSTAGIDVSSLYQTNTGEEFMRALADMIPKLDEGQRAQVQSSLGLSDGVFRSLAGGVENLDETMKRANALTGSIDQLTENSRKLADNSAQLGLIIEGVKNELAEKFLPSLIGASAGVNNFLKEYRPEISKGVDVLAENPQATAGIGIGAATTVAGAGLSKIGLSGVGGALKGAGQLGMAISLADLMTPYIDPMFDKLFGVVRQPTSVEAGSGQVLRTQADIDYLDQRDEWGEQKPPNQWNQPHQPIDGNDPRETLGPPQAVATPPADDLIFGHRSAADSMPPSSGSTPDEDRQASADALAGALSRAPIKVQNQLGVTLQIDGQALDSRITNVTERQNYEALGDLRTTTER